MYRHETDGLRARIVELERENAALKREHRINLDAQFDLLARLILSALAVVTVAWCVLNSARGVAESVHTLLLLAMGWCALLVQREP